METSQMSNEPQNQSSKGWIIGGLVVIAVIAISIFFLNTDGEIQTKLLKDNGEVVKEDNSKIDKDILKSADFYNLDKESYLRYDRTSKVLSISNFEDKDIVWDKLDFDGAKVTTINQADKTIYVGTEDGAVHTTDVSDIAWEKSYLEEEEPTNDIVVILFVVVSNIKYAVTSHLDVNSEPSFSVYTEEIVDGNTTWKKYGVIEKTLSGG